MEKFQELKERANKRLSIADHILTQTYPLVKDPRLLLSVMENIFLALSNSMGAILYHERLFKKIPPFQDNFDSKFNMFRAKIVDRYKIDRKHVELISEIKSIIIQHRKSPIEFSRKDKLVICNEDYKMKTISIELIKEYLLKSKQFIELSRKITSKNEHLFNKE
ncbi:hypothetical protein GF323_01175 [Candidatus Woesearchaeota archaeon]|nr:hypothetical protein [Candidatus Woesearchaeota archaeon]